MSAKATFWAWRQLGLKSSSKLVLLCLANNHNESNDRCDPGPAYISENTGLNIKTIRTALKDLEQCGILTIHKRAGTSSNYVFNFGAGDLFQPYPKTGRPENGQTQKRVDPKTDDTLPENGSTPYPKTGTKPNSEPNKNLKYIYKDLDLSNIPPVFSVEVIKEFIDHRINKKSKLTQNGLERNLSRALSVVDCIELSISPDQAILETIDADWKGVKIEWLINRLGGNKNAAYQQPAIQHTTQPDQPDTSGSFVTQDTLDELERLQGQPNFFQ